MGRDEAHLTLWTLGSHLPSRPPEARVAVQQPARVDISFGYLRVDISLDISEWIFLWIFESGYFFGYFRVDISLDI